MKAHLQELWKETVPKGVPCPLADAESVLQRVNAELDDSTVQKGRRCIKRRVKYVLIAAAVLLLGGTAVAAVGLPEYNVLDEFFYYGSENEELAQSLVDTSTRSVSDDNYTMTVTSSLSDGNDVYFTFTIEAKTDEARSKLSSDDFSVDSVDLWLEPEPDADVVIQTSWFGSGGSWTTGAYDSATSTRKLDAALSMGFGLKKEVSIRYSSMEEGIELKFPVKTIKDIKLKINAEGQGAGNQDHAAGGPVTLETVTLTPVSIKMNYTSDFYNSGTPVVFFLMKDGTIRTMGEVHASGPSGSSSGVNGVGSYELNWTFLEVQDTTLMEAVIFEDMAYPLDGGKPYPVDTSQVLYPFTLPLNTNLPNDTVTGQNDSRHYTLTENVAQSSTQEGLISVFALCQALGIPCDWDEATGTASMTFRGSTITLSTGSNTATKDGIPYELDCAPIFRDGELWATVWTFTDSWSLLAKQAYENHWLDMENRRLQEEANSETSSDAPVDNSNDMKFVAVVITP